MLFVAMPINQPTLPHVIASSRLQGAQITVVARRTAILAVCSILSGSVVLATFWQTASHFYLLVLLGGLVIMHGASIVSSRIWLARTRPVGSPRMLRVRIAASALIAVVWATSPIALMPIATEEQRQLLIYIGAGLTSSSILIAPILPAASLFAGIITIGFFLPMPLIDHSIASQHAVVLLMFLLMTAAVVRAQHRDFIERITNELTLEEQSDIIGLLLREFEENASDFLWEADAGLRITRASDRLSRIMACSAAELQGGSIMEWISQGRQRIGEEKHNASKLLACLADRLPFRDLQVLVVFKGQEIWLSLTAKPVFDAAGTLTGYRGVGSDVTAAHRSDEQIAYLASYDSLTDLPNRALFQEALTKVCAHNSSFALLSLDLDGFKAVNDTFGHSIGDALLVAVAGRLRASLRDGDVVARLGGDEFAVLQSGADANAAAVFAQRIITKLSEPYQLGSVQTSIGVSVGIALARDGLAPKDLLIGADLALYQSKAEGRRTWYFFEPEMAIRAQHRHRLQTELRLAIERNELTLEFQPIFGMTSGTISGAEALVRWQHPERGPISPAEFIPIAEESGLIVQLGAWVLRRACEQATTWVGETRVAVNFSPLQFRDPGLYDLVDQVLADTGLSPQRLEVEITESVFLEKADTTLACLRALRARGIHIALDDFGTGYSSLSYLRSFPFDKVKIDQSFIRDLGVNSEAIAIVRAIVGMASSLGMRTTGEGVETEVQAELLQLTGCSQVQGYLFGRPGKSSNISDLIALGQPE